MGSIVADILVDAIGGGIAQAETRIVAEIPFGLPPLDIDLASHRKRMVRTHAQSIMRAAGCPCMKVWVYALMKVPIPGQDVELGGVTSFVPGIGRAFRLAAEDAGAAIDSEMSGDPLPESGSSAKARRERWKEKMLLFTMGDCPPRKCPIVDDEELNRLFTEELRMSMGMGLPIVLSSNPNTDDGTPRRGVIEFRGQKCYAFEIARTFGGPGSTIRDSGLTVTFLRGLRYVVRFIFCFYEETWPPPSGPGDPEPGGGPTTGGRDRAGPITRSPSARGPITRSTNHREFVTPALSEYTPPNVYQTSSAAASLNPPYGDVWLATSQPASTYHRLGDYPQGWEVPGSDPMRDFEPLLDTHSVMESSSLGG